MSKHCTQCGAENQDAAQICFSCGAPIDSTDQDPLVGSVMLDSYRVTKVLGSGGMAVVYLGVNQLTGQEVAIKTLPPELAAYAEVKTRFLEEARTLAKLEHPNIVHLINFAEDKGRICLVMQYAQGETFEEQIDRLERIPPIDAVHVIVQTLGGLAHAHAHGVVHRDIKPSNIMVRPDGSVKVTDFGIAKITRDHKLTQTGQTMGTVRYMAPEQVRGKGVDHRTDLYAVGISLYEAVVGDCPFDGDSQFEVMQMHLSAEPRPPREAGAPISEELEAVILKSIAKPQDDRYQSAKELRKALRATPEGRALPTSTQEMPAPALDISPPPPVEEEVVVEAPRRKTRLLAITAAGVLLLVGGLALWLTQRGAGGDGGGDAASAAHDPGSMGAARRRPPAPRFVFPARYPVIDRMKKRLGRWSVASRVNHPHPLFIYADRPLKAERLARGYAQAQKAYAKLLVDHGVTQAVAVRPLTLVLVRNGLLNDKTLWAGVATKQDGPDFYVPKRYGSVLFVVSDKGYTERQLRYSLAIHLCPLELSNVRCAELARLFEKNDSVDLLP